MHPLGVKKLRENNSATRKLPGLSQTLLLVGRGRLLTNHRPGPLVTSEEGVAVRKKIWG
jgi:hypothetical protein